MASKAKESWGDIRALNYARKLGGSFVLWPYGKFGHFNVMRCVRAGWLTAHPPAKGEVAAIEYRLTAAGRAHVLATLPIEYLAKERAAAPSEQVPA